MPESGKQKKVLVLLIGEILDDPRVFKTCMSLCEMGADVTVACTNPNQRPERERNQNIDIVRFPHRTEFALKRFNNWLQSRLHPGMGQVLSQAHEDVAPSSIKSALRNFILNLNYRHYIRSNLRICGMMVRAFTGESFDLVHCNDVETLYAGIELRRDGSAKLLLYDSHEFWPGTGIYGSSTNKAIRKLESAGIHLADFVITVNPMIADMLQELYNLKKVPSVVMNCPNLFEGEIHINVAPDEERNGVSVAVRDFGEGIPKEFHEKIFEKFYQAGLRDLGRKTDTGLGLAFCRMAVETLGGTISVESEPKKGSCFTFSLPDSLPAE